MGPPALCHPTLGPGGVGEPLGLRTVLGHQCRVSVAFVTSSCLHPLRLALGLQHLELGLQRNFFSFSFFSACESFRFPGRILLCGPDSHDLGLSRHLFQRGWTREQPCRSPFSFRVALHEEGQPQLPGDSVRQVRPAVVTFA